MATSKIIMAKGAAKRVIPIKPITSWSYSRYALYKECPLKFKLKNIDKVPEKKSDAMQRGIDVHNMAEGYVNGTLPARVVPGPLLGMADDFKDLRKLYKSKRAPMIVEDNWAFTKEWGITTWNNWSDCWLRVKLDLAVTQDDIQVVTDWKTGKYNQYKAVEYNEQLELYAVAALSMADDPGLRVIPRLGWLDEGFYTQPVDNQDEPLAYGIKDKVKLQKVWQKRVAPMFNDKHFAPKPNRGCQWCDYSAAKGGQCKY